MNIYGAIPALPTTPDCTRGHQGSKVGKHGRNSYGCPFRSCPARRAVFQICYGEITWLATPKISASVVNYAEFIPRYWLLPSPLCGAFAVDSSTLKCCFKESIPTRCRRSCANSRRGCD